MSTGSWSEKERLRAQVRGALRSITAPEIQKASAKMVLHLREWPVWIHCRHPLLFVPMLGEPQVQALLDERFAAQSVVWLPRVAASGLEFCRVQRWDELVRGTFGILEPASTCEILRKQAPDLVFVPGVAFTRSGERLGRGGGYYDRLLSGLPKSSVTLGICFAMQLLGALPMEAHDCTVDFGLSQEGFWKA